MPTSSVEWRGDQFKRLLEKTIANGMKAAGDQIVAEAKSLVPVDTGKLRDSIEIKELNKDEVSVGSDLEYALFVEIGTESIPARPYLQPAMEHVKIEEAFRKL